MDENFFEEELDDKEEYDEWEDYEEPDYDDAD